MLLLFINGSLLNDSYTLLRVNGHITCECRLPENNTKKYS
jgi:hypothetical protein